MNFSIGDLVSINNPRNPKKCFGVIIKSLPTSVFEGGEKAQIVTILYPDSSLEEVMSWDIRKFNA